MSLLGTMFVKASGICHDGIFPWSVSEYFHSRLANMSLLFLLSVCPDMSGHLECPNTVGLEEKRGLGETQSEGLGQRKGDGSDA